MPEDDLICTPAKRGTYPEENITIAFLDNTSYTVNLGHPLKLTIYIGHAKISGVPAVALQDNSDIDLQDPCKEDEPYVWLIDEEALMNKNLVCLTNVKGPPNIPTDKVFSVTYILEGGPEGKQWTTEVKSNETMVKFKARITLV